MITLGIWKLDGSGRYSTSDGRFPRRVTKEGLRNGVYLLGLNNFSSNLLYVQRVWEDFNDRQTYKELEFDQLHMYLSHLHRELLNLKNK